MAIRKSYGGGEFKGKIALEAFKEEKPLAELSSLYEVYPNQIKNWKGYLVKNVGEIYKDKRRERRIKTRIN